VQVNAYRNAVDESPILLHHGDRPPEISEVSEPERQSTLTSPPRTSPAAYSAESIVQLLERLTRQVDDSRLLEQEEPVANLEHRFTTFVEEISSQTTNGNATVDQRPVVEQNSDRNHSNTNVSHRRNDVQHSMPEAAQRSDDYQQSNTNPSTPNMSNTSPFATVANRRQSIMPVLSPGPSRTAGTSSPYPDDDPPANHGLHGYGALP
jgi:hypothetical protein